jgi:uncharacterized membrane protein YvlD (DUF360 family)
MSGAPSNLPRPRNFLSFYKLQFETLWEWRPGPGALARRIIVSFLVSAIALWLTAVLLPGITMLGGFRTLVAAVIILGAVDLLIRPLILGLLAGISVILVGVATLVLQILSFLIIQWIIPDYEVRGVLTAFVGSIVYALFTMVLSAVLGTGGDESYWATLIQQLAARRQDAIRTDKPGVVIIQIDGLAHEILAHQIRAGRVPHLARWVRDGKMTLDGWEALLPSQTSASQAGILHGKNDFIPAFRWWEKKANRMMVSNHPLDAIEIVRRASNGEGLLSNDGASVGNLVSGDAVRSYITMATIKDKEQGLGQSASFFSFFVSPSNYMHALVLTISEMFKEYYQAARQARAGMIPIMHRGWPYPIARAATNVLLRSLGTSLVMEEMYRGTPVIYIDYTDYDEIAHHSGPERAETLDALDGVDKTIASLERASLKTPRPYRFIVLSDHGQSLGSTFLQRYHKTLQEVIGELMGGPDAVRTATESVEDWGQLNAFLSEASQVKGATGAITRAVTGGATKDGVVTVGPEEHTDAAEATEAETPELVVCASGNLGLIFFPRLSGRATLETLEATYPNMVDALASHPGIGLLMVRSEEKGTIAVGPRGLRVLGSGEVTGEDPVAQFGEHAETGLLRVDSMEHCGDIVAISRLDPGTGEVAAFEELIGSHGGLGGLQTKPMIMHPSEWVIDEPIIGAEAVYRQIRHWLSDVGIELGPQPATARATSHPD